MSVQMDARNATLDDLAALLRDQQGRKVDIVASAPALRSENGVIIVEGAEVEMTYTGVSVTDGYYKPTKVFDEGLAQKLSIPVSYLGRMRQERPDLYDANVNGLLHGRPESRVYGDEVFADPRKFLFRGFRGDNADGVARAFLSDSYKVIDHLDVLTAALQGVKDAGVHTEITSCDLTERNMYVRINAPEVLAYAPGLMRNYRSPFSGQSGADVPGVSAGLTIRNSETGGGAFHIVPRVTFLVCSNGATITKDALRAVHLGGKLDEGKIRWSEETSRKQLELITLKARDAVASFLDADFVARVLRDMEEAAGVPVGQPEKTIKQVSRVLLFNEETQQGILDHFIRGGDTTAGGVFHAMTAYAQVVEDAELAASLEDSAFRALELAAAG